MQPEDGVGGDVRAGLQVGLNVVVAATAAVPEVGTAYAAIAYNSSRNRHCPKCQALAYQNKSANYGLMFAMAAETLIRIAADPKQLGARSWATLVQHIGFGADAPLPRARPRSGWRFVVRRQAVDRLHRWSKESFLPVPQPKRARRRASM